MADYKAYCTRRLREAGLDPDRRHYWTEGGSKRFLWKADQLQAAIAYVIAEQGEPMEVFLAADALLIQYGLAPFVRDGR
jgi:hypothetical protein